MPDLLGSGGEPSPGDRLTEAASARLHVQNADLVLSGGSVRPVSGVYRASGVVDRCLSGATTDFLIGNGIFAGLDLSTGIAKFHVGDPAANHIKFDGTNMTVVGTLIASSLIVSGNVQITGDLDVRGDGIFQANDTQLVTIRANAAGIAKLVLEDTGDVGTGAELWWDGSGPDLALFKVSGATVWSVPESTVDITFAGDIVVSGTGPHVIGGTVLDYAALQVTGAFTSGGADIVAFGLLSAVDVTGALGDTGTVSCNQFAGTIATSADTSLGIAAQLVVNEPNITNNLTSSGKPAVATSLYISGEPTEGTANSAAYIAAGRVTLVGTSALSTEFAIGPVVWNSSTEPGMLFQYRGSDGYAELQINNEVAGGAAFTIRDGSGVVYSILNDGETSQQGDLILSTTSFINFGAGAIQELTIASSEVTATGTYHRIDTESDTSSDNLDTINGGTTGDLLIIQASSSARTVVCRDAAGNLLLAGDFSLTHTNDKLMLLHVSGNWHEISRSNNTA